MHFNSEFAEEGKLAGLLLNRGSTSEFTGGILGAGVLFSLNLQMFKQLQWRNCGKIRFVGERMGKYLFLIVQRAIDRDNAKLRGRICRRNSLG